MDSDSDSYLYSYSTPNSPLNSPGARDIMLASAFQEVGNSYNDNDLFNNSDERSFDINKMQLRFIEPGVSNVLPQPKVTNVREFIEPGVSNVSPQPKYEPPAKGDFGGDFDFEISLQEHDQGKRFMPRKEIHFLPDINTVFLEMLVPLVIWIKWNYKASEKNKLFIRATLVYAEEKDRNIPINRCKNHKESSHPSNKDIPEKFLQHTLRHEPFNNGEIYNNSDQKGCSVIKEMLNKPSRGSTHFSLIYKLCCGHNCSAGIARRPVEILFTLESENGEILGRKSLGVRVVSSPNRDLKKYKIKYLQNEQVVDNENLSDYHSVKGFKVFSYENYLKILNTIIDLNSSAYSKMNPENPKAKKLAKMIKEQKDKLKAIKKQKDKLKAIGSR